VLPWACLAAPDLGYAHTPFGEIAGGMHRVTIRRKRGRFGALGARDSRLGEGAVQFEVRGRQFDAKYGFDFSPILMIPLLQLNTHLGSRPGMVAHQ